jgi:SAM-dependent methyltransferase
MNEYHRVCGSDEWRELIRDVILPATLADIDLGTDVLEVGPGYGATTDVLAQRCPQLTAVEIDEELAAFLIERFAAAQNVTIVRGDATALEFPGGRFSGATSFTMLHHVPTTDMQDRLFAEVARVLQPGGVFVASDGVYDPNTAAAHEGDTYNPVDPPTLGRRLGDAGFADVEVRVHDLGWSAVAHKPGA